MRTIFNPSCPEEDMLEHWKERIDHLRRSYYHGIAWQGANYPKILEAIHRTPSQTLCFDNPEGMMRYNQKNDALPKLKTSRTAVLDGSQGLENP